MIDEVALINGIQDLFGLEAMPFFWSFNTLWGLGIATHLPAILFWLGWRKMGFRTALFAAIAGPIIIFSKWVIAEPRPFYVSDDFTPLKVSTGFGMPSGNAFGIATLMLTIAYYARLWWVWLIAAFLIIFVGLARVYYGVHSPSQVLWGWVGGILLALSLIWIADRFASWFKTRTIRVQLLLVAVAGAGVTLIGVAIDYLVLQSFVVPEEWVARYNEIALATDEEDAFTMFNGRDAYVFGGSILGFGLAGILLLRGAIPDTPTRIGKALNLALGFGLFFGFLTLYRSSFRPFLDAGLYEAYLIVVFTIFPLLSYALTPILTQRLLSAAQLTRKQDAG